MSAIAADKAPSNGSPYLLPNSAEEHARLEEQSACLADLMGRTYHAPLPALPSVLLDIGCGTGVVTTYLGNSFPKANVYGVDLSPVPQIHRTPANVTYIQGDIHELSRLDLRLAPKTADLSFSRLLVGGIVDWRTCVAAMANLVKPGGYMELQEPSMRIFDAEDRRIDTELEWMQVIRASMEAKGYDPDAGFNARGYMVNAGLVDIQTWEYKMTVGSWLSKKEPQTSRFGELWGYQMRTMVPSMLDLVVDRSKYSAEQVESLKEKVEKDLRPTTEGEAGIYFKLVVIVGRQPLE
ncbi:hypothetical protein FQN49_006076 [Arthroderma sp. PD_2]|nr:hypothetical protein FQN49_006076 [Arthroderma sp. PD_2]